jgi:hypothetical protein
MKHSPEYYANAIFEALHREKPNQMGRDRYRIMLAVLKDDEMREETCRKCRGRGKITVTCESSGGTFYDETRKCPGPWDDGCEGTGKIRRLQFNTGTRI